MSEGDRVTNTKGGMMRYDVNASVQYHFTNINPNQPHVPAKGQLQREPHVVKPMISAATKPEIHMKR